jgi:selenocysteine lyase/cysteine desulfurase
MQIPDAFSELEEGVHAALEMYSNVHRGSGHNSLVSTHLYEQARLIVLEYMGLNKNKFTVIFCTPARYTALTARLKPGSYQGISSHDINLALGVNALVVKRKDLPSGIPFQSGGGTARLVSTDWIVWASAPDRFEAGTPAIINVIAFARALCMIKKHGDNIFSTSLNRILSSHQILQNDDLENYSGRELLQELVKTLIGRDIHVPTIDGYKPYINLDNSASTPTFMPIRDAFHNTLHQSHQTHKEIIHEVRKICSEMFEASPSKYDIIFTSNTTEAINLVTESFNRNSDPDIEPVVIGTLLEHSSNDLPWRLVPDSSLIRLSIDNEGFVNLKELDALLNEYNFQCLNGNKRIRMVAVTGASNVLGTYNDLFEISRITHRYGAQLLVDAAQMVAPQRPPTARIGFSPDPIPRGYRIHRRARRSGRASGW